MASSFDKLIGPMSKAEYKRMREFLGLSNDDVARVCGVHVRTPRRWESGFIVNIPGSVSLVMRILASEMDGDAAAAARAIDVLVDGVEEMADGR